MHLDTLLWDKQVVTEDRFHEIQKRRIKKKKRRSHQKKRKKKKEGKKKRREVENYIYIYINWLPVTRFSIDFLKCYNQ
jgi:hypothetical protein